MVIAPKKPKGFPTAIATSPGRTSAECAGGATLRLEAEIRRAARSRRESRALTSAVNSRPSQRVTSTREPLATCAFVMMVPSLFQITPEPLPRPPGCTKTVYRRTRSATSPNPAIPISIAPCWPFAHNDANLTAHSATQKLCGERLANLLTMKMRVYVFQSHNRLPIQPDQKIADQDAGRMCRPVGLHLQHNYRRFFAPL